MTKEKIFEIIKEKMAEATGIDIEDIHLDSNFVIDIGISSLELITLISVLEDTFSIDIPEEKIRTFESIKDIVDYIDNTLSSQV